MAFLTDQTRNVHPLVIAEDTFRQRATDPSQSALRQDDARQSIEVLHSLQRMQNQLSVYNFMNAPQDQGKLVLAGVTISVRLDFFVHGSSRGIEQIGGAILRMTQDDADTEAARGKRRDMGLYVAALARIHLEQNFTHNAEVANRLCMSIDIRHGEVFPASPSNARRAADIENACRFIAAIWDGL